MSGWGYFFLTLILLAIIIPLAWIGYTRFRAHRAGLPPPPLSSYNPFSGSHPSEGATSRIYPAPTGAIGWVKNKFASLTGSGRGRTGGGAYEQPLGGGPRRGLDPDEAWDSRVGAEADVYGAGGYYEEQELGLQPPGGETGYASTTRGQGGVLPDYGEENAPRGRSLSRDLREEGLGVGGGKQGLDRRYDEEVHGGAGHEDPFGDGAERSELRGVSPRPAEEGGLRVKGSAGGDSPTERRSMFRENV